MNSQLNLRFTLSVWIICAISLTQFAVAQTGGVELVFPNNNPINLTAGDQVCFQLAAKDAGGNAITDWSSSGIDVTIFVTHTIVDTDTLLKSYNRHPDGYTWSKLTIGGQTIFPTTPHHFSIPKTLFINGLADACYQASAAENDVRITVTPTFANLIQISPPINYSPAALDNFLVELTNQSPGPRWHDVYAHRPFEFIVVPRDRFLNHISALIPVRIESGFPAELDTVSGPFTTPPSTMAVDPFDPTLTIIGRQSFFLRTTAERLPAQNIAQWIRAYSPLDPTIEGISDPFYAIPHAPNAFVLQAPADQTQLTLTSASSWESFTWEKPAPPDPFTNISISRFSPIANTDSTHYTIHFTDVNGTQDIAFESFDAGQLPTFGIRQSDLAAVIDQLSGTTHVPSFDVIWYVEATDGEYTTFSTPVGAGIPGHRLTITNSMIVGKGVGTSFAPQIPTTMRAGGEVNFELQALDNGSLVTDWNDSGDDITLFVRNTTVGSDTSSRSWNADPIAYSWAKLTVNGQDVPSTGADEYSISKSLFTDGHAVVSYWSSKAENDIRFEITPSVPGLSQSSPAFSWEADTLENFLVEITWPDPGTSAVYYRCPFELVVTPRDRFLNPLSTLVATKLSARFPDELTSFAGQYPSPYDPYFIVQGLTTLKLIPGFERDASLLPGQMFDVQHDRKPSIRGNSDQFSVISHAPNPFSLISPPDSSHILLQIPSTTQEVFTWEKPDPADPYTDKQVSVLSSLRMSDEVHYEIVFADPTDLSRHVTFASDDNGLTPRFTTNHGMLAGVIDQLSGVPSTQSFDAVWYVRATDTLYVTDSTPFNLSFPGARIRLTKDFASSVSSPAPSLLLLLQNYPNPFNPSTTMRFVTTKPGVVSLKVFDLLGSEVATIHDGMLEAGAHSVQFDASKLRSGVYMYRMEAEGQMLSRRMVIMK